MSKQRFFYCPVCGGPLVYKFAYGMDRLCCTKCGRINYENPVVGVAAIILNEQGKILLVKRAPDTTVPNKWCIPCGYVEYDEDVRDAVKREALEETGLVIEPLSVYAVHSNFHNPEQHTVGIWFTTKVVGGTTRAGDDAVDYIWSDLRSTPELAFATDRVVLDQLLANSSNKMGKNI
ncbi:MAG: NUDIX domain-containing protein [Acidaminococcaceae bacterium]|jgi:ADP-ribose pyrophosphatase YjhB (NUDIX family)|nr:NUDIX domain-containing protein [Acidaminococcaceae bacterium]